MTRASSKEITEKIKASKKILLVTHSRPSIDAICSVALLYAVLKNHFKKEVDVAIPTQLSLRPLAILDKVGITKDTILNTLPQKVYTISIKKEGEKIESINFNEADDRFNFVITPFNGVLDLKSVDIHEEGSNYDLIITIDTPSLAFLGDLYKQNAGVFNNTPTISFDNHKSNAGYALYTLVFDNVDTTSQVVLRFLDESVIKIDELYANILFAGISSFTNINMKSKVRDSLFFDLAELVKNKADIQKVNDMLYGPTTMNEIFLVGDILDSSNEGTASVFENAKIICCKISLNKEELETVDIDKTAQVVLWNIKSAEYKMAYVIFQRSVSESIVYIYAYNSGYNLAGLLKEFQGKGDKGFGKLTLAMDMNSAEEKMKEVMGITFAQKQNKLMNSLNDDFDPMLDDFGDDDLGDAFMPKIANTPIPPLMPSIVPAQPAEKGDDLKNKDEGPVIFDPRLGK